VQRVVEESNRKQLASLTALLEQRDRKMAELVRIEVSRVIDQASEKANSTATLAVQSSTEYAETQAAAAAAAKTTADSTMDDDIFSCGGTDENEEKKTSKKRKPQAERKQARLNTSTDDYMEKVRNKILNARKKRRCDDMPDSA
jgi:hypothetical protein